MKLYEFGKVAQGVTAQYLDVFADGEMLDAVAQIATEQKPYVLETHKYRGYVTITFDKRCEENDIEKVKSKITEFFKRV